ncbi:MAG: aspartate kinase, partial [Clostridia bacterium]|nr:aspartate kinase [Clostridia bacterium]MBR2734940.1 aspartate kinase [Clostridia bacterium]
IVAGFQGINENNDITTLGRGGSDTSAVALAATLNADACKIYTDVDGVYTADPRIVLSAKKWSSLDYDTMFELASYGAQVLHNRSIDTAKKYGVKIEVLSSLLDETPGTSITTNTTKNQNVLSGISLKNKLAKVSITFSGDCQKVFDSITRVTKNSGIPIDQDLKPVGKRTKNALSLIIPEANIDDFLSATQKLTNENKDIQVFYEKNKSEISVINVSDSLNLNIASIIFETLSEMNIEVEMVACDQKRVSIVVSSEYANSAVNAIHSKLFEEDNLI